MNKRILSLVIIMVVDFIALNALIIAENLTSVFYSDLVDISGIILLENIIILLWLLISVNISFMVLFKKNYYFPKKVNEEYIVLAILINIFSIILAKELEINNQIISANKSFSVNNDFYVLNLLLVIIIGVILLINYIQNYKKVNKFIILLQFKEYYIKFAILGSLCSLVIVLYYLLTIENKYYLNSVNPSIFLIYIAIFSIFSLLWLLIMIYLELKFKIFSIVFKSEGETKEYVKSIINYPHRLDSFYNFKVMSIASILNTFIILTSVYIIIFMFF